MTEMGNRTRLPDMHATWRARSEAKAAQEEAQRVVERWNAALAAGKGALWSPTIRPPSPRERHGRTFSAPAAGQAARSISAPLTAIRSHLSEVLCWGCGAHDVR